MNLNKVYSNSRSYIPVRWLIVKIFSSKDRPAISCVCIAKVFPISLLSQRSRNYRVAPRERKKGENLAWKNWTTISRISTRTGWTGWRRMFGRHRLMDRQGFPRSRRRRRSIFRVETTKRTPPLWESQFFFRYFSRISSSRRNKIATTSCGGAATQLSK